MGATTAVHDNDAIVRGFCHAFTRLDADELIDYFTADALYHNIPLPPLVGREAIYRSLEGLRTRFQSLEIEILRQVAAGDLVMNERIDIFTVGGKRIVLPIAGVFELVGGKIQSWREYFDLATFRGG